MFVLFIWSIGVLYKWTEKSELHHHHYHTSSINRRNCMRVYSFVSVVVNMKIVLLRSSFCCCPSTRLCGPKLVLRMRFNLGNCQLSNINARQSVHSARLSTIERECARASVNGRVCVCECAFIRYAILFLLIR